MKILTEKQFNKLLYERQCETERRFHEIEDRRNLLDKIERLERRVFDLEMKMYPQAVTCINEEKMHE